MSVKTVAELQVSPPPATVPTTPLPLTYLDIKLLHFPPVYRIIFYNFPHSASDFHSTVIPNLTASLSAALGLFHPFVGELVVPPPPGKPHIRYPKDRCSVPLTVAETTDFDFRQLLSHNRIYEVASLEPLFPPPVVKSDGDGDGNSAAVVFSPLFAVKITLFPGFGFSIGTAYNHATTDGMAFNRFMKTWASISKSGDRNSAGISPPCFDRASIKIEKKIEVMLLEQSWELISSLPTRINFFSSDKYRSTFSIDGDTISKVKASLPFSPSDFVAASALIWTVLIKSLDHPHLDEIEEPIDSYMFVADCRRLLNPPLPETYFGNCLSLLRASVKRSDLVGEDGLVILAREIGDKIKENKEELAGGGVLRGGEEKWDSDAAEMAKKGRMSIVGGSPRMRAYETDFGFGRPEKADLVMLGVSMLINLSDGRDEKKGGIEFGLLLSRSELEAFSPAFDRRLKEINSDRD
ncbi:Malonyl-coenzyme A:anthocyanin 3-O-glucoside-6''-O-malonyltransferase [Linum perenne]